MSRIGTEPHADGHTIKNAVEGSNAVARNLWCPSYSMCLDAAVKTGLDGWDCGSCPHRTERDQHLDPAELEGCILLLWAIFLPERFSEYLRLPEGPRGPAYKTLRSQAATLPQGRKADVRLAQFRA